MLFYNSNIKLEMSFNERVKYMGIIVSDNNVFVLETLSTHYVIGVDEFGNNRHIHWGKKCDISDYSIPALHEENSHHSKLDEITQEYTAFGGTMYRGSALKAEFFDACRELHLKYSGYSIDENALKLIFNDEYYPVEISLNYSVSDEYDIITRWTEVKNTGNEKIRFEKLFSAEFNLPSKNPYNFKNTNGAWGAEFIETNTLLEGGTLTFESRRGISGHNNSPSFIAYQNADENMGTVYFASLAYSGNFKVSASRDLYGTTRVIMGISDFDFEYALASGESFNTPKVYCGMAEGFGNMSRQMSRFAVEHILPKSFNSKPLPVLYNSWEATYFDVNSENQSALAERAAEMGVELFVMDDGWFGKRNSDNAGLGDWFVNKEKFPNGLAELIEKVNSLGMEFGLWVEPEMVNPDSDLYRAHPDWVYHYEHRKSNELRNQLVLNMTRKDVQEYVFHIIDKLLDENNIKYIKWDMNRPFSEAGAENLETPKMLWYLHTKAVYDIVDRLKEKHKEVAFESCASGGGRSDYGALEHFDMVWTSDNTDAADRMTIQRGYTLLHPAKVMRAWVTDIEGINKPCSLDFRFNIAMQGALGIGGNLTKYSEEDLQICKKNIALYKEIRRLVQFGDLYRVLDAEKDEVLLNHYVSPDKSQSVAFLAAYATRFYKKRIPIRFEGLAADKRYRFTFAGKTFEKSGAYLMNVGIPAHIRNAYFNEIIIINEI